MPHIRFAALAWLLIVLPPLVAALSDHKKTPEDAAHPQLQVSVPEPVLPVAGQAASLRGGRDPLPANMVEVSTKGMNMDMAMEQAEEQNADDAATAPPDPATGEGAQPSQPQQDAQGPPQAAAQGSAQASSQIVPQEAAPEAKEAAAPGAEAPDQEAKDVAKEKAKPLNDAHGQIDLLGSAANVAEKLKGQTEKVFHNAREGENMADDDLNAVKGLKVNSKQDWPGLAGNIMVSASVVICSIMVFSWLRRVYPLIYNEQATIRGYPFFVSDSWFAWISASLSLDVTDPETQRHIGLDAAMLIRFTEFGIKLLLLNSPALFVLAVAYHMNSRIEQAGVVEFLESLSMDGLPRFHASFVVASCATWYVAATSVHCVLQARDDFLAWRREWLLTTPKPQATTVFVEKIPEEYRSEAKLRTFFNNIFGSECVEKATLIKHTADLPNLHAKWEAEKEALVDTQYLAGRTDDSYTVLQDLAKLAENEERLRKRIVAKRREIKEAALGGDLSVFCSSGFVTFKNHSEALAASRIPIMWEGADAEAMTVTAAPDPSDVHWSMIKAEGSQVVSESVWILVGRFLLCLAILCYSPVVLFIVYWATWHTDVSSLEQEDWRRDVLQALHDYTPWLEMLLLTFVASFALKVVMTFLPYVLSFIIQLWSLPSHGRAENMLQVLYFRFHMIFTVLFVAVGGSVLNRISDVLFGSPMEVLASMGVSFTQFTHFYLNWLAVQWFTFAFENMRLWHLAGFTLYQEKMGPDRCRAWVETWMYSSVAMGTGIRCTYLTVNLIVVIVFCVLEPLVVPLGLMCFCIDRVCIGYLVVFAEGQQTDRGGLFFMTQLQHVLDGVLIFTILLTTVLLSRAPFFCGACLLPAIGWVASTRRDMTDMTWEELHLEDLPHVSGKSGRLRAQPAKTYVQPELRVDDAGDAGDDAGPAAAPVRRPAAEEAIPEKREEDVEGGSGAAEAGPAGPSAGPKSRGKKELGSDAGGPRR